MPKMRSLPGGRLRHERGGFEATVARDGSVDFEDVNVRPGSFRGEGKHRLDGEGVVVLFEVLRFDFTDVAMRAIGDDPYSYEKLVFLEQTREQRMKMRDRSDREDRVEALRRLVGHLDQVWADETRKPLVRRRILFELWDECAEDGRAEAVQAARTARAIIVGFIRHRLPEGSAMAYGAGELEALNRRRESQERFAPYD